MQQRYKLSQDVIKFVEDVDVIFKILVETRERFAIVSEREALEFRLTRLGKKNIYLPPETTDASFGVSLIAVAMQKNTKWKTKFDLM